MVENKTKPQAPPQKNKQTKKPPKNKDASFQTATE